MLELILFIVRGAPEAGAAGKWKVKVKFAQSCPTLCDPTKGSNPGLLHCRQIFNQLSQKGSLRILEWVAYPFSRGSFQHRNQTRVSCTAGGFFTSWAIREAWWYPSKKRCVRPSGLDHNLFCPGLLSKGAANIQVLSCYRLSWQFTASCEDRLHTLLKRAQVATRALFLRELGYMPESHSKWRVEKKRIFNVTLPNSWVPDGWCSQASSI